MAPHPLPAGAVDLAAHMAAKQQAGAAFGTPASDDVTKTIDVYDSEIADIQRVLEALRARAAHRVNYDAFQREAIERFADIGFKVDVRWYETDVEGVLQPEVNIVGRTESGHVFDRDRQVHEVVNDYLGLGEGGVVKVDKGMMKSLEQGSYRGQGGHQH